ncbi:MAG: hypothetical protein A2147_07720 [Chloroflexi bacterium RBG_16_57_8]|nr:MAG: hypothetical protein A2147_07720 [Chloroflexi bacterium RBG_16_57_8]
METKYIWSRDKLRALLDHPSDGVQSWASCRVLELYPDMKDEMLAYLPDASPTVAFHLLDAFQGMVLPDGAAEPLRRFLQAERSPADKAVAALLLVRLGYELPNEHMKALPLRQLADDLALTDTGFSFLLLQISQQPNAETADEFFYALACGCGAGDLYNLLSRAKSMSEWRRAVKKRLESPLSAVLDVKDSRTALELLEESLQESVAVAPPQQGRFPSLMAELEKNSKRCTLLAERISEILESDRTSAFREVDLLAACALSQRRDGGYRSSLAEALPDVARLWEILTTRRWTLTEIDAGVVELLSGQPAEHVLHTLREALGRVGPVYAEYALRCLEAANLPGRYDLLLDALEGSWSIDVAEDAEAVIRRTKPQVLEAALASWKSKLPGASKIRWLETCPTPDAVQFLSDNYERYMTAPDSRWFVETLGEVGALDFFERLLAEWRPGELGIGSAIEDIADVNDIRDERIAPVVEDVRTWREELQSATGTDVPASLPRALTPLRCTACGHTYHYVLENLYLDKKAKDIIIGDIVQCKGCGSIETYERTADTFISLNARLILGLALAKAKGEEEPELPVKGYLTGVTAAGRVFRTASDAYHFLARAVERDPDSADLLKRLGNVLANGNRPDLALPYYLRSLQIHPRNAEVTYLVVKVLLGQGKYHEAIPYVDKLPELIREGDIESEMRRDLFLAVVEQATMVFEQTGHRVAFFPRDRVEQAILSVSEGDGVATLDINAFDISDPAGFEQAYRVFLGRGRPVAPWEEPERSEPLRVAAKVGRNDLCPCGSGKKYKKCCGR